MGLAFKVSVLCVCVVNAMEVDEVSKMTLGDLFCSNPDDAQVKHHNFQKKNQNRNVTETKIISSSILLCFCLYLAQINF